MSNVQSTNPASPIFKTVPAERHDRTSDGKLAHPSSEVPKSAPIGVHKDGTECMSKDELKSAGIVDDAGRKIVPGQAFLLIGAMFIGFTVLALLGWLVVVYIQKPEMHPGL